MAPKSAIAAVLSCLISIALSTPMPLGESISFQEIDSMPPQELATFITKVDRAVLKAFECLGQSCLIADTAGSTGRDPTLMAEGANLADIRCIASYNPVVGEIIDKFAGTPPKVEKQNTGASTLLMTSLNTGHSPRTTVTGKFTGKCTPNILIFAKGTLEPGALGILVGNSFAANLPKDWSSHGVAYDADIPGDFCLGLPGGMVAKDVINQAAAKCPDSRLFLGGYSQGAMVIRNGLARADEAARKKVKGVITFGDPFNGANIKGYDGPIEIFCTKGDGVCTGNFEVAASHLAYGSSSAKAAQRKLLEMANGGGNSNCCHPPEPAAPPSPEEWAATLAAKGLTGKGALPKISGGAAGKGSESTPKSSGGAPKSSGGAPKSSGGTPRGSGSAPKSGAPKAGAGTPKAGGSAPKTGAPKTGAPKTGGGKGTGKGGKGSSGAAPKSSSDAAPKSSSSDAAPKQSANEDEKAAPEASDKASPEVAE